LNKIYIDCTNTYLLENTTGIQRVVKKIIQALRSPNRCNFHAIPFIRLNNDNYAINLFHDDGLYYTKIVFLLSNLARKIVNKLLPDGSNTVSREPISAEEKSRQFIDYKSGLRNSVISIAQFFMYRLLFFSYLLDNVISIKNKFYFKSDDVLFVADSFWLNSTKSLVKETGFIGCKTIVLIYDIIPLTNPNFVEKYFKITFEESLEEIKDNISAFISISNYSMREINNYFCKNGKKILSDYFYLGADICKFSNINNISKPYLADIYKYNSVFLMVGTLEPRKNHNYVLNVFEKLWDQGIDVYLCIVGRQGWLCGDLIKRIITHSEYCHRLWYCSDLDDNDLAYCYEKAKALIIASIVEGFGLPLVEAMHYGKHVFASNINVFREIAGPYPEYFDLSDSQTLVDAICKFEKKESEMVHQPQAWISWDESVDRLLSKVSDISDKLYQESPHE
jgi:alpha-1,2-rhamnosyltransferase